MTVELRGKLIGMWKENSVFDTKELVKSSWKKNMYSQKDTEEFHYKNIIFF